MQIKRSNNFFYHPERQAFPSRHPEPPRPVMLSEVEASHHLLRSFDFAQDDSHVSTGLFFHAFALGG
jgi:hypothetical protein